MEQLKRVRDLISARLGIYFAPDRLTYLDKKLKETAQKCGAAGQSDFIRSLLAGKASAEQMHVLVESLTVGETYFFRESATIEALDDIILPEIARERGRTLRLWCAGCSTGEEPYSIAMYLADRPELAAWNSSLIASDINSASLERARAGLYTKWSFRTISDHYKTHFFTRINDKQFEVKEVIRRSVKFFRLNLAEDGYPSPSNGTEGVDVIFCRNVLMYFLPDTIRAIIDRFAASLAPNGWLIVSQTECSDYFSAAFDTIRCGDSFVYRKKNAGSPAPISYQPRPASMLGTLDQVKTTQTNRPLPPSPLPQKRGDGPKIDELQGATAVLKSGGKAELLFARAENLANQGLFDDACVLCEEGIGHDSLDLHGHYLHATILQVAGKLQEAVGALRKVLYLEPDFIMGHYAMGNMEQKLGNMGQALRCFENAAKLLTLYRGDEILPESGGISAGHMTELLNTMRKNRGTG